MEQYDVASATLTLKHRYPEHSPDRRIVVDIDHLLEDMDRHNLDCGAWVNVMGYVKGALEQHPAEKTGGARSEKESRRQSRVGHGCLLVAPIMLWSAGAIDLGAYERALEARKQADLAMASS